MIISIKKTEKSNPKLACEIQKYKQTHTQAHIETYIQSYMCVYIYTLIKEKKKGLYLSFTTFLYSFLKQKPILEENQGRKKSTIKASPLLILYFS